MKRSLKSLRNTWSLLRWRLKSEASMQKMIFSFLRKIRLSFTKHMRYSISTGCKNGKLKIKLTRRNTLTGLKLTKIQSVKPKSTDRR